MMLLSRNAFSVFCASLALHSTQAQPNFNVGNLIPQWLPQCFTGLDAFNPKAIVDCIQGFTQQPCYGTMSIPDTFIDIAQCINTSVTEEANAFVEGTDPEQQGDATSAPANPVESFFSDVLGINFDPEGLLNVGRVFVNATLDCLDPLVECVQESIQAAVDNLDPCLNRTVIELLECGRVNAETCQATCNGTVPTLGNPFEGINSANVATCRGIQQNVMNPMCDVVSCCEPCVEKVEALVDCMVNEQLDQVPATGRNCNLACPAVSKRRLGQDKKKRSLSSSVPEAVAYDDDCLQFAPGLTGNDTQELSARADIFYSCVSSSFGEAVEQPAQPPALESDEDTTSGGRSGSLAGMTMMAAAAVTVFAF